MTAIIPFSLDPASLACNDIQVWSGKNTIVSVEPSNLDMGVYLGFKKDRSDIETKMILINGRRACHMILARQTHHAFLVDINQDGEDKNDTLCTILRDIFSLNAISAQTEKMILAWDEAAEIASNARMKSLFPQLF